MSGSSSTKRDHRLVLARQRRQVGHEEGVGQEAHVEHDVGLGRDAVLEAERQQRDRQVALAAPVALLDERPQHVHGERARVDQRVGLLRRPASVCRSAAMPARMSVSDSGCRRRVSEKRRMRISSEASRNSTSTVCPALRRSAKIDWPLRRGTRRPARRCPARPGRCRARLARQLDELRHQRQRQVVDRVEAEVLEGAQRRRLARARDAGDDDQPHSTSSRQRRSRASASARSSRS